MFTNLEYRAKERKRKRESRRQASEVQWEKGRQRSRARERERERKKEKKRSEREKYDMSSIKKCNQLRSFWKFHVVVVQNNGKEKYKKVCCTCNVAFLLIRPIAVFHPSPAAFAAQHYDFIFCLNKLWILSRALLLALAKAIYYFQIVKGKHPPLVFNIFILIWIIITVNRQQLILHRYHFKFCKVTMPDLTR